MLSHQQKENLAQTWVGGGPQRNDFHYILQKYP